MQSILSTMYHQLQYDRNKEIGAWEIKRRKTNTSFSITNLNKKERVKEQAPAQFIMVFVPQPVCNLTLMHVQHSGTPSCRQVSVSEARSSPCWLHSNEVCSVILHKRVWGIFSVWSFFFYGKVGSVDITVLPEKGAFPNGKKANKRFECACQKQNESASVCKVTRLLQNCFLFLNSWSGDTQWWVHTEPYHGDQSTMTPFWLIETSSMVSWPWVLLVPWLEDQLFSPNSAVCHQSK